MGGLEITKAAATGNVEVDRRLWLTADKDKLVEDGDPKAAYLWASRGKKVHAADAERLGYVPTERPDDADPGEAVEGSLPPQGDEVDLPDPAPEEATVEEPVPEEKAVEAPAEDKAAPTPPNKARRARKSKET
jgi:hypothetical protein